jgi:putative glutamine amidotransferase
MFQSYAKALEAAGAIPVLLPLLDVTTSTDLLDRLDGLLLAGGDDVNPARYGQTVHAKTEPPDDRRDQVEIDLALSAVAEKKPLLAICRGMQVLNVAFGGTLTQDIADLVPNALDHTLNYEDYQLRSTIAHSVDILPNTRLASITGNSAQVNSFHHQAIAQIGEGLHSAAYASDGIVEALEGGHPDQFLLAVQWHPEDMYQSDPKMLGLFESFTGFIRA